MRHTAPTVEHSQRRGSARSAFVALVVAAPLLSLVAGSPAAAGALGRQDGPSAASALPTPLEHYEEFDNAAAARALLPRIALRLDPATLQRVMAMVGPDPEANPPSVTTEEALEILERIDLEPFRAELTELLLHGSNVLELIPEGLEDWVALVHDSLIVVLNGMTMDRLRARIAGQAALPADATRGDRMLAFGAETPTFQKLGQIMARSSWLPEDLREPLQSLESDIVTTNADDLVATIEHELGGDTLRDYRFEFEDEVLSEASIGALIGATIVVPGENQRRRVVVKVIKAYAIEAIGQDLESINTLLGVLEEHRDFYGIGATPLVDMFQELRSALAREIRAADEQDNLRRARAYFAADPRVEVPYVYECSSGNVTVMERIEGGKVTDAFPDDEEQRRRLARRLATIMVYDVMFHPADALFHGDPHAGNVFHVGGEDDPYRIALLDWGLLGVLSHEQRAKLIQVGLGLQLKHADRLRKNMDALIDGDIDLEADEAKVDAIVAKLFAAADEIKRDTGEDPGTLRLVDRLASELAMEGYTVNGDILLYVKSNYTIQSVISDLDPDFDSGDYVAGRVKNQVFKEMPKRLGNTIWVPGMWSHEYRTMASNNDVWASALNSIGLGFKAIGVGFWKGISFPFR
jgi:ubiquinone biosynthesis protein